MTRAGATPSATLVVKVDVARVADPAAHVARVVREVAPEADAEEVFPGLRTGASAGLVTVRVPGTTGAAARRKMAEALASDAAVASVHEPKSRRPR